MNPDKARHSMVITFIAAFLAVLANVGYTQYVNRTTEAKFCGVLRAYDSPNQPPLTERSKEIQRRFHELRKGLRC